MVYRATHRGTYENDILLGGFVQRHIATFSEQDLTALEDVLELPENDLADWLTGRSDIPPDMDAPMLRRIRDESLSRAAGEGGEGVHEPTPSLQPSPTARERER